MEPINLTWFDRQTFTNPIYNKFRQNPIAYFCAEFALSDIMPIYSGGLGILSGDTIKEASELGIPLVGVGLLYKKGFFKQTINDTNYQSEEKQEINPRTAGLSLILNNEGNVYVESIPIDGRTLYFQTWHIKVGTIDMYFLDSHVPQNSNEDQAITDTLYCEDIEIRLLQEILLGIGGEKILYYQGIYPSIYHMNEGHSAFLALGIIHHYMKNNKVNFEEAFRETHKKLIFTNHTLVPAGNHLYLVDLIKKYLEKYCQQVNIPLETFIEKGLTEDKRLFSMTLFGLNLSFRTNAVSKLHAIKAKDIWPNHEMVPITNGVNVKRWMNQSLYRKLESISIENNITLSDSVDKINPEEVWNIHQKAKEEMLRDILNITGIILDKDILTITWARRMAAYKRPDLLFADLERLRKILTNIQAPVQIIISGKPHPTDTEEKEILHKILDNIQSFNDLNRIVFIPNYSLSIAEILVAGSDVWLNTPIRGFEACGTSGMKSCLNGGLQLTLQDGWTDEVDWTNMGWIIAEMDSSLSLYDKIENEVTHLYYDKANNLPKDWIERMIRSIKMALKNYSTERMLMEYFNNMYLQSLKAQSNSI